MDKRRYAAVIVLVVMGLLQFWDSRVFTAGAPVVALSLLALSLPIAALLFTERQDARIAAVVTCAVLLLSAKVLTPQPLPALGVVAAIALAANWLAAARRA